MVELAVVAVAATTTDIAGVDQRLFASLHSWRISNGLGCSCCSSYLHRRHAYSRP